MNSNIDWNLLLKYLNRDCSPEEQAEVSEWMNAHRDHEKFVIFLETIWQMEPEKKRKVDADEAWDRFNARYDFLEEAEPDESQPETGQSSKIKTLGNSQNNKSNWFGIAGVAASILLIIFVTSQIFDFSTFQDEDPAAEEVEYRVMSTDRGERARIILGNGSVVHLNSESTLKMPEVLREHTANRVYLEGEAFFEITRSENTNFLVVANGTVTSVLGTRFIVRSYPEDSMVTVVVAEGEVSLGYDMAFSFDPVILTNHQRGIIGNGLHPDVSNVADLNTYLGWTEGKLIFDDVALPYMTRKLERWFGIQIETEGLDEELMSKKLTASFSERQPVDDVLQSISLVLGLSIEEADTIDYVYKFSN